jgi:hypothetical protein
MFSQHDRLLNLLKSYNGDWVPLPKILDLHIAQYNRVINDLRNGKHDRINHNIENKVGWVDRSKHSWFRLVVEQPRQAFEEKGQLSFIK